MNRPTLREVLHSATKPVGLLAITVLILDAIALYQISGFGPVFLIIAIVAVVCFCIGCKFG